MCEITGGEQAVCMKFVASARLRVGGFRSQSGVTDSHYNLTHTPSGREK